MPAAEARNYRLASQLGITDYLLDRFTIAGTPEDCRDRIGQPPAGNGTTMRIGRCGYS